MQADLGAVFDVVAVATQGRNAFDQWVKSYMIGSSLTDLSSSIPMTMYEENGADKVINTDIFKS